MKKILMPTLMLSVLVMILSSVSPVLADSGDTKSYKRNWAIPIGDASGTLEITDTTNKADLIKQAIPMEQAVSGYSDIQKANLGKAVNDDGKYFLVWKLVKYNESSETNTKSMTIYVLDAGTGKPLTDPITKEGGSCGDKNKSQTKTSGEHA